MLTISLLGIACADRSGSEPIEYTVFSETTVGGSMQDVNHRVATVSGLLQPEAVRYDADTDMYFVSHFNGSGSARDSNGFITRIHAGTGEVTPRFAVGESAALHAPRGMYIVEDILWVADVDGIHGFDKHTGAQTEFVDFSGLEHGFLNDVAADADGNLYVTDTGGRTVFVIQAGAPSILVEDLINPNGITFDDASASLILAPWDEGETITSIALSSDSVTVVHRQSGSKIDGIELFEGQLIFAMQSDSTVQIFSEAGGSKYIKTRGKPADIAIDTRRRRVAVPYIALGQVDIWDLPSVDGADSSN